MNTFFRMCIYICFALMFFSLVFNFVESTGAFSSHMSMGQDIDSAGDAISSLTKLDDPDMNSIWAAVTLGSGIAAIALAWITHSVTPIGLWLFGEVFWTSWIRTQSIISIGGYLPENFILIFTVGMMFLFIAAIVGILTGSG